MTLRYDSFLTPFASPALGRIDVSGLEQAGQMLEQRSQYEQNRLDRLAKEGRDYELNKSETEGRNRYYDAQAVTHRMAQEEKKNADQEKRSRALFDAFRKSKNPTERKAIMDELQRLGFTVEEQDTELPAEAPASPASAVAAPTAPTAKAPKAAKPSKPGKTPKANKSFMAALGHIVNDVPGEELDRQVAEGGDASEVGPGSLASVLGYPGAFGESTTAQGASAGVDIPAPAAMSRGGKFVIKDKSGVTVHSFDEPLERMHNQMAMKAALAPLLSAAKTERERAAAQAAVNAGAAVLDTGKPPETASDFALKVYHEALNQEFRKSYQPGAGGGGASAALPSKLQIRLNDQAIGAYDKVIDNVSRDTKVQAAQDRRQFAQGALQKLDDAERGGLQEHAALKDYVFSISGKVVTDDEMDKLLGSAGAWTKWKMQLAQYTDAGRMPPEFKSQLRHLLGVISKGADIVLDEAGKRAHDQLANLPLSLQTDDQAALAETAGAHFSGKYTPRRNRPGAPSSKAPAQQEPSDENLIDSWTPGKTR